MTKEFNTMKTTQEAKVIQKRRGVGYGGSEAPTPPPTSHPNKEKNKKRRRRRRRRQSPSLPTWHLTS
eukprot:c56516_g1_i1 orf=313-513(+)